MLRSTRRALYAVPLCLLVIAIGPAHVEIHAEENAASAAPTTSESSPAEPAAVEADATPSLDATPRMTVETAREVDGRTILLGRDARQQLIVTQTDATGQTHDLTRAVSYAVEPAGVVEVDASGLVTPLANGTTSIVARDESGAVAHAAVEVQDIDHDARVNFPNQITPIFTKLGCNSGGCHGKASGQNGFRLSLLGFEPGEDYEYLVKESRGRRLFPAAPDRSLLLLKPINAMPHGGGQRLTADSHEYRLMRRWIAQGMPYGSDDDPTIERISVLPTERTMTSGSEQQLVVVAHYSDGSTEDVTQMAQFEANDPEMAESSPAGLVTTLDLSGDVAVMVRYQSQVAVFRAMIPLGAEVNELPPARNFIDEFVFKKLQTLGMPPSPAADDAPFLRRVSVDVAGRLPTPDETREFLADEDPAKRDRWIDALLAEPGYAAYFANKWSAVLRNKRRNPNYRRGAYAFHEWIRQSLYENKPYDQFAREILAATGEPASNPPAAWYREVKTTDQQVEDSAQLFLGLRIQCARCHHHPFEKWSQQDYYGFAAFFSRVATKEGLGPDERRVYHRRGVASAQNPKTKQNVKPTGLDAAPLDIPADDDPRHELVDWMTAPDNAFFARALVNRYWKHFFSRGLVDPEDDMRVTNPSSNPELLDALAQHFIDSGFDLKDLVRTICQSTTYQLSSLPNEYNANDKQNFSRYYPKRLTAEVLLDSLDQVTGASTKFSGLPPGVKAVELPDTGANNYFLTVFGKPEADSACECERSQEANLAQSLHLLNSSDVQGKLSRGGGRAAQLAGDASRTDQEKISELYQWVYSREPVEDELTVATAHIEKNENKQQAYEDILWALVNTKEFLFNH